MLSIDRPVPLLKFDIFRCHESDLQIGDRFRIKMGVVRLGELLDLWLEIIGCAEIEKIDRSLLQFPQDVSSVELRIIETIIDDDRSVLVGFFPLHVKVVVPRLKTVDLYPGSVE